MNTKVNPIPEGFHTVTTSFTFKNSLSAIEFYKKAFNAEVIDVLPTLDGKSTMHALIKIGDSALMMGDEMPNEGCPKSAETMGGCPIGLYVYVPNVDEAFKQAIKAGAIETMPVADMFWGDRCGWLKDPFGYTWTIATHISDLTKDEIQEGAKEFCKLMSEK
jgi:PhnB protein